MTIQTANPTAKTNPSSVQDKIKQAYEAREAAKQKATQAASAVEADTANQMAEVVESAAIDSTATVVDSSAPVDELFDDAPAATTAVVAAAPVFNVPGYDFTAGTITAEQAEELDVGDPSWGAFPQVILAGSGIDAKHLGETTKITANQGAQLHCAVEGITRIVVVGINFNNNAKNEADFARLYPDLSKVFYSEPTDHDQSTGWARETPLPQCIDSRSGIPMSDLKVLLEDASAALPGTEVQVNQYLHVKATINHITGAVKGDALEKYRGTTVKVQLPSSAITPFQLAYNACVRRLSLAPIDKVSIQKGWIPRAEFRFEIGETKTNKQNQTYTPWVISVVDRLVESQKNNTTFEWIR